MKEKIRAGDVVTYIQEGIILLFECEKIVGKYAYPVPGSVLQRIVRDGNTYYVNAPQYDDKMFYVVHCTRTSGYATLSQIYNEAVGV